MTINKKASEQSLRATPTGGAGVKVRSNEKSIAKIEMQIEELRSSPKSRTKAVLAEIKGLQTLLNKIYIEYKQKVIDFEKENRSHLIFLRSTHGFHKLLGNSLLFYAFNIAPKLEVDVRIYADNDYEAKSEAGVTSVRSLEELEKKFNKLGIKREKIADKTGNIVIYKLPWEYKTSEIEKLSEQNTTATQKYNHVIMVENTIPILFMNLNDLMKACYENVRRLEVVARDSLGNFIIETIAEMIRIYVEMSNGRINEIEGLRHIRTRLNKIKTQIKILTDLKLWNNRTYARIGEVLIKIQGIVDLQLEARGYGKI